MTFDMNKLRDLLRIPKIREIRIESCWPPQTYIIKTMGYFNEILELQEIIDAIEKIGLKFEFLEVRDDELNLYFKEADAE